MLNEQRLAALSNIQDLLREFNEETDDFNEGYKKSLQFLQLLEKNYIQTRPVGYRQSYCISELGSTSSLENTAQEAEKVKLREELEVALKSLAKFTAKRGETSNIEAASEVKGERNDEKMEEQKEALKSKFEFAEKQAAGSNIKAASEVKVERNDEEMEEQKEASKCKFGFAEKRAAGSNIKPATELKVEKNHEEMMRPREEQALERQAKFAEKKGEKSHIKAASEVKVERNDEKVEEQKEVSKSKFGFAEK